MALCHKKLQHAIFAIFCHVALVALCLPTLCPGERWGPAMDHLPFSICGNVTIFAMLLFWYVCHVCGDSRVRFEVRSSGSVRFEGRGAIRGQGCFQKTQANSGVGFSMSATKLAQWQKMAKNGKVWQKWQKWQKWQNMAKWQNTVFAIFAIF